jgi:hypothetical protein
MTVTQGRILHTYQPISPGKPRQVKALALKAISSQKRAAFTNICCILLCPLLMVGFAAAFGQFISGLIQKLTPISGNYFELILEILYCSNVMAMDKNNIPNLNMNYKGAPVTSSEGIAAATTNETRHVNFNLLPVFSRKGPPGASIFSFQQPCVHWFGEDYPYSDLYERPIDMALPLASNSRMKKSSILEFRDR